MDPKVPPYEKNGGDYLTKEQFLPDDNQLK